MLALLAVAGCSEGGSREGRATPHASASATPRTSPSASPSPRPTPPAAAGPCPPLPPPAGPVVPITPEQADALPALVRDAAAGTTFLLADGHYRFGGADEASRRLQIRSDGVTLRSASGAAAAVVLDAEYRTDELVTIDASDVTLAHFTLTRARNHLVHASPARGRALSGVRLYGMRLIDAGEQLVKVNPDGAGHHVDDGTLACSLLRMTDAGRPLVEREPGGCYTGGIDAHAARGWRVAWNQADGIYCAGEGLAEHAIHFWAGSRDTVVENNLIADCARGIGLGLGQTAGSTGRRYADVDYGPSGGWLGHVGGTVRGNVVWADIPWFDTGIELAQAGGAAVLHNTVVHGARATGAFSSIDSRWAGTDAVLRNNLVVRLTTRDGARPREEGNRSATPLSWFAAPARLDFHLVSAAAEAIDRAAAAEGAGVDLDGAARDAGAGPDLGADEHGTPTLDYPRFP